MCKKLFITFGGLLAVVGVILVSFLYWFQAFTIDDVSMERLRSTDPGKLRYLNNKLPQDRGRILAVVTSVRELGSQGKPTGYELSELSRAYWVFTTNGFDVDVASPDGGEPYALLDTNDMGEFDYAFLNDPVAKQKIRNTLKIQPIDPAAYQAVYFVGGKGAMFDFPDNFYMQKLIADFVENKKIIAAVCHGPAALVNVHNTQGEWLFADKIITSFIKVTY